MAASDCVPIRHDKNVEILPVALEVLDCQILAPILYEFWLSSRTITPERLSELKAKRVYRAINRRKIKACLSQSHARSRQRLALRA